MVIEASLECPRYRFSISSIISFAVPGLAVSAKLAWFIDIARKNIMNLDHPRGFENA
jgi:hypothetical protein